MSRLMINGMKLIEGKFSFESSVDITSTEPFISISGVLVSEEEYLEEINRIENERYIIDGISIYKEEYGSDEDAIAYYFKAKQYAIKEWKHKPKKKRKGRKVKEEEEEEREEETDV